MLPRLGVNVFVHYSHKDRKRKRKERGGETTIPLDIFHDFSSKEKKKIDVRVDIVVTT